MTSAVIAIVALLFRFNDDIFVLFCDLLYTKDLICLQNKILFICSVKNGFVMFSNENEGNCFQWAFIRLCVKLLNFFEWRRHVASA